MNVIWFSEIKWSYLKTRKQHVIDNFPPDWRVLFLETYVRGKTNQFLPRREGRLTTVTIPFIKSTPFPGLNRILEFSVVRGAFNLLAGAWLLLLFRWTGFHGSNRVLFTSNIYYADLLKFFRRRILVYDCNDYPPGFPGALRTAHRYFEKTVQQADLVITVSDRLRQDVQALGHRHIHIVGNGVDVDLFASGMHAAEPGFMNGLARPVLLYVGVLSDWFDFDLADRVAETFSGATLVLVGPVISENIRHRVDELSRRPNVRLLGPQPHHDLPAIINCASVCLIPFIKNDLIARFSPNKLFEYLAVGKPVVTLDYTKEIQELNRVVSVARDAEGFVRMIADELAAPRSRPELLDVARSRSWKTLANGIADLVIREGRLRDE